MLDTMNLGDLLPLELDDEYILADRVMPQPTSVGLSLTARFNTHSRIFWAALESPSPQGSPATKTEPCSCTRSRQPMAQLLYLKDRLHDLKYMLDGVPPRLRQWSAEDDDEALHSPDQEQRRVLKAQFASMRANIHVTHLWLQSIISDQVDAILLGESSRATLISPPPDLKVGWAEREDLCRQLLHVLHGIPEVHLEPNGHYLVRFSPRLPMPIRLKH
jgi:hypothetical protein